MVQLSHQYMTTGKTIALTRWTFVGKMMPLLLNTLSRFVIDTCQSSTGDCFDPQRPLEMSGDVLGSERTNVLYLSNVGRKKPGMLLNILQCTDQSSQQRVMRVMTSIAMKLRRLTPTCI